MDMSESFTAQDASAEINYEAEISSLTEEEKLVYKKGLVVDAMLFGLVLTVLTAVTIFY